MLILAMGLSPRGKLADTLARRADTLSNTCDMLPTNDKLQADAKCAHALEPSP